MDAFWILLLLVGLPALATSLIRFMLSIFIGAIWLFEQLFSAIAALGFYISQRQSKHP